MIFPSWAKVGAKVVMVDFSPDLNGCVYNNTAGTIFTILALTDRFSEPAVRMEEHYSDGVWSKLSRFRPLVEKSAEDDIKMFHRISRELSPVERLDLLLADMNQMEEVK